MYNQTGGTTLPAPVSGWGTEIALDIEWAHSIAPLANLEIVEASSDFEYGAFHGGRDRRDQARRIGRVDELRR